MISPAQFFEDYVRERTAFYEAEIQHLAPLREKFFSPHCTYDSRIGMAENSRAERIIHTLHIEGHTVLETTGRHQSGKLPLRYHLIPAADTWRIEQVEMRCPNCAITDAATKECRLCGGAGWFARVPKFQPPEDS